MHERRNNAFPLRVITPFSRYYTFQKGIILTPFIIFFTLRNLILIDFLILLNYLPMEKSIYGPSFEQIDLNLLYQRMLYAKWLISQGLIPFWVRTELYHLYIWYHTVRTQNRLSPCGCIDIGPWSTWFWRGRWKCEKLQADRQTDDGRTPDELKSYNNPTLYILILMRDLLISVIPRYSGWYIFLCCVRNIYTSWSHKENILLFEFTS